MGDDQPADLQGVSFVPEERHLPSVLLEEILSFSSFLVGNHGELYFHRDAHRTLPLEMKSYLSESGWYPVIKVHLPEEGCGNVSYDLQTPRGVLERVGYRWFEKARWTGVEAP